MTPEQRADLAAEVSRRHSERVHPRNPERVTCEYDDDPWPCIEHRLLVEWYEAEAEIARLRAAIGIHGRCWCVNIPGYPRGDRHAPGCDYDPELLAALDAWIEASPEFREGMERARADFENGRVAPFRHNRG